MIRFIHFFHSYKEGWMNEEWMNTRIDRAAKTSWRWLQCKKTCTSKCSWWRDAARLPALEQLHWRTGRKSTETSSLHLVLLASFSHNPSTQFNKIISYTQNSSPLCGPYWLVSPGEHRPDWANNHQSVQKCFFTWIYVELKERFVLQLCGKGIGHHPCQYQKK